MNQENKKQQKLLLQNNQKEIELEPEQGNDFFDEIMDFQPSQKNLASEL